MKNDSCRKMYMLKNVFLVIQSKFHSQVQHNTEKIFLFQFFIIYLSTVDVKVSSYNIKSKNIKCLPRCIRVRQDIPTKAPLNHLLQDTY